MEETTTLDPRDCPHKAGTPEWKEWTRALITRQADNGAYEKNRKLHLDRAAEIKERHVVNEAEIKANAIIREVSNEEPEKEYFYSLNSVARMSGLNAILQATYKPLWDDQMWTRPLILSVNQARLLYGLWDKPAPIIHRKPANKPYKILTKGGPAGGRLTAMNYLGPDLQFPVARTNFRTNDFKFERASYVFTGKVKLDSGLIVEADIDTDGILLYEYKGTFS